MTTTYDDIPAPKEFRVELCKGALHSGRAGERARTFDASGVALMVSLNALLLADVLLWPLTAHWAVIPALNAPALIAIITALRNS